MVLGTAIHIEHLADEPGNPVYRHVQDIVVFEARGVVSRGLAQGLGLEVELPLRMVRDRIEYEDLNGGPFTPSDPELHHRNQTRTGLGDPLAWVTGARLMGPWTLAGRAGVSIPIGRTEDNPFALGRAGIPHEHVQFGSGTWDPLLGIAVGRRFGKLATQLSGTTRLALAENAHDYQSGHRSSALLMGTLPFAEVWSAGTGILLTHETAETWSGREEEEGNLGRTDLRLALALGRGLPPLGRFTLNAQLPLASATEGEQMDVPLVLGLTWNR